MAHMVWQAVEAPVAADQDDVGVGDGAEGLVCHRQWLRGRLYVLKHDWQKAIDDFSALISFKPLLNRPACSQGARSADPRLREQVRVC